MHFLLAYTHIKVFATEIVIASSVLEWLGVLSVITAIWAGLKLWNCHEHGCYRLSWHKDEDGHPVCKVHHPDHPNLGWFRVDKTHPRHKRNRSHQLN